MSHLNYAAIQPLVASEQVQGSSVAVQFRCPTTGVEASSTGTVRRLNSVKSEAARSVKKNLWSGLRRSVTRAVADALGSGTAGRIARDLTGAGLKQAEQKTAFSKEEVQEGVVAAFQAVQGSFRWNDAQNTWAGVAKASNPFEERLAQSPISERYDQGILARALVELSAADGEISEDEVAFISDFIDPAVGMVAELAKREALSAAELGEATPEVREAILMLSWACAMSDEDVADAEAQRLVELAEGFGLTAEQNGALRADAQHFLFEQALASVYENGSRNEEAFATANAAAATMGISGERASQWDAAYRKAAGIV